MAKPLTESELRFCHEFVLNHNGTRAYRLAFPGCAYASARTQASRLLTKPNVVAEVAAAEKEALRSVGISAKRVLRELAAIAFQDPIDLFEKDGITPRPLSRISPRARRTIQVAKTKRRKETGRGKDWIVEEVEYRTHSKMQALDSLAKHLGLTNDGVALKTLLEALAGRPDDQSLPAVMLGAGSGDSKDGIPPPVAAVE